MFISLISLSWKTKQLPRVSLVNPLVDLSLSPGEGWLLRLPLATERGGVGKPLLLGYLVHLNTVPDLDARVCQ